MKRMELMKRISAVLKATSVITAIVPAANIRPGNDILEQSVGNAILFEITDGLERSKKNSGSVQFIIFSAKDQIEATTIMNLILQGLTPATLTGNRTYGIVVAMFRQTDTAVSEITENGRTKLSFTMEYKAV